MTEKNLYTDTEGTILSVGRYVSAFNSSQKKRPEELNPQWLKFINNFNESLFVLHKHKDGDQLLSKWYNHIKDSKSEEDIHSFVKMLWDEFIKDHQQINLIANDYYYHFVWEFILGVAFFIASPTALILFLPFLVNPVVLAPVFILTCIMIPLIAHFMLINPASKHLKLGQTLKKSLSFENSSDHEIKQFRTTFFKEKNYEEAKKEISDQYDNLQNSPDFI